jgi:hypothetical protein
MRTLLLLLAAGLLHACGSEAPPVLTVAGIGYSEDQLLGVSDERRETLAYLTAFGLAVADSSTGELGRPLVDRWSDDVRLEVLSAELTLEHHGVGDDVLESRYLTNPEWELTVRHILFFSERWQSEQHRADARAKADRALVRLREGADFAATASALSEEPGAEGRAGLLTPGREGSWVPEFWAAALALEPGGISPVTETQYGYHILRLEDRTVVPFQEARSTVVREVARQVADPAEALEAWLDRSGATDPEARRAGALAEADRRGVALHPSERTALERQWDNEVYRWTTAFGFQFGATPQQVSARALDALARSGQNAEIARSQIRTRAELFTRRYPMELGSGTP